MHKAFNIMNFINPNEMCEEERDRCDFWLTCNRINREMNKCNYEGARIQVNTNWDLETLSEWLKDYEDKKVVDYLRYGWPLNSHKVEENTNIPRNQKGARDHPEEIRKYLKDEIKNGSIIGPFTKNPFGKAARFSPLDTRAKKESSDLRIILNLSHPFEGGSVNSSINKEQYQDEEMKLVYPTVDNLAKIIMEKRKNGKKVKILKRDLSKAYRQLWGCPSTIHLLGYVFENRYYYDVTLSMGSASSAYCCQRTTNCIKYVFKQQGFDNVNYLDDLGAAEEEDKAEEAFDCLGWILSTIGIRESLSKACAPAYIIVFLGILFNTLTMTMQITEERLVEIKALLEEWMVKRTASLKEVQVLLGKLNFAASTVRAGRIFVSRIINEVKKYNKDGTKRRISKEMKKDIQWWLKFMETFDGITMITPAKFYPPDAIFSTDSCLQGCGGWCNGKAFKAKIPEWLQKKENVHINELELLTVIIAIRKWATEISNKNLLAFCDNQTTIDIVNKGAATNKFAQACLREMCFLLAKNNTVLKMVFINGKDNIFSDCLSRWHDTKARETFWEKTQGTTVRFEKVDSKDFEFSHDW